MTWGWLVTVAAWVFLAGVTMAAATAVPAVQRRFPRLLPLGFGVAAASPLLVLLAWLLPRLA